MKKLWNIFRKSVVFVVGVAVLVLGLILIPLPGPGILVTLAGLFILSLEFAWAQRHFQRVKDVQKKLIEKAKNARKPPPGQNT